MKPLLHLVDQSGANYPDGRAAELNSCSIYLGMSPHRSVYRPGIGSPQIRLRELLGSTESLVYWPTSWGVVCDAPDSTGLGAR